MNIEQLTPDLLQKIENAFTILSEMYILNSKLSDHEKWKAQTKLAQVCGDLIQSSRLFVAKPVNRVQISTMDELEEPSIDRELAKRVAELHDMADATAEKVKNKRKMVPEMVKAKIEQDLKESMSVKQDDMEYDITTPEAKRVDAQTLESIQVTVSKVQKLAKSLQVNLPQNIIRAEETVAAVAEKLSQPTSTDEALLASQAVVTSYSNENVQESSKPLLLAKRLAESLNYPTNTTGNALKKMR